MRKCASRLVENISKQTVLDISYQGLNALDLLSRDDLPHSVGLCESELPTRFLNLLTSQASVTVSHAFLRN